MVTRLASERARLCGTEIGTIIAQDTQLVQSYTTPQFLLAENQSNDRFSALKAQGPKEDKWETEDLY